MESIDKFVLGVKLNTDNIKSELQKAVKDLQGDDYSKIHLDFDDKKLDDLKKQFSQLSNINVTIFKGGASKEVETMTNELGQLLKITTELNNQGDIIGRKINVDASSQLKEQKALYGDLGKLLTQSYDIKKNMINAEGEYYNELQKELSVVTQLQNETGKKIKSNGYQNTEYNNNLLKQQLNLQNQLNQAKAKKIDSDNSQALKETQALKEEQIQVQKLIDNKIKLLQIDKQSMQRQFGVKVDTRAIDEAINKLKSMDNVSLKDLRNEFTNINTSIKETKENAKEISSEGGVLSKITNVLGKFGVFITAQTAINATINQFKNASQYVETLDRSLTNMRMITGKSSGEIQSLMSQYKDLAAQLHTTNTEMLSGMEEVTRAGYNNKEGKDVMSASLIGSKISGQDVATTTQELIAIKNAFDMTGDSMEHVVDVISKLDNTAASSFAEIAGAMQRTAYSAQEAGTPFDKLAAYITTASEKTRKPAEEIGNSLRTIYARYSNIKLGNLDDDDKSINDTEIAMNRIGIQIRKSKGEFKDFDEVLTEFMNKYKQGQLSQVDYLAGVQALAGTRQRETLMALCENMDDLDQHTKDVASSTGSAKKMMEEAYSNSIDAKLNDLSRNIQNLYEKMLSSNTLKSGIDLVNNSLNTLMSVGTQAGNVIGNLNTRFGTASTATMGILGVLSLTNSKYRETATIISGSIFPTFTNWSAKLKQISTDLSSHRKDLTEDIANLKKNALAIKENSTAMQAGTVSTRSYGLQMVGLQAKVAGTTIKLVAAKVAAIGLQTVMSLGLSAGISLVVSGLSGMISALAGTDDHLQKVKQSSENLQNSLSGVKSTNDLLGQYEKISRELKDQKKSTQEKADLENKLKSVKEELYQKDSDIKGIIDDQNKSLDEQVSLVKQLMSQEAEKSAKELDKSLGNGFWHRDEGKNAEDAKNNIESNMQNIQGLQEKLAALKDDNTEYAKSIKNETQQQINQLTNDIKEQYGVLTKYNANVKSIKEAWSGSDRTLVQLSSDAEAYAKNLIQQSETKSKIEKSLKDETSIPSLDKLKEQYQSANEEVSKLKGFINDINKSGSITQDIQQKIIEHDASMAAHVGSVKDAQDALNSKIKEQEKIAEEAYRNMILQDQNYYNTKYKNDSNWQNALRNIFNDLANKYGLYTQTNLQNMNSELLGAKSLAEQRSAIESNLILGLENMWKQYYQQMEAAGAKIRVNGSLVNRFYSDGRGGFEKPANMNSEQQAAWDAQQRLTNQLNEQMQALSSAASQAAGMFSGISMPKIYGGKGISEGINGGTGKTKKNRGKRASTKRKIEDMEKLSDRYVYVNNALQKVNNELERNQKLLANAKDKERINLEKQRISLLKQQIIAQRNLRNEKAKQLEEDRRYLASNSFTFGSDGQISNQNSRLDYLRNWANKANSEKAQKNVKKIADIVKEYNQLLITDIPKIDNEILGIKNDIISAQKDIAEVLKKQRDDYKQKIQDETDALKKEIDKRKELRNREYEEDSYQDELDKQQKQLYELQNNLQNALRTGDEELIKEARRAISEQQDTVSKTIADRDKTLMDQIYEDEEKAIDESTENKLKNIEEQLSDDNILKLVQNGVTDLSSVLNKITNSTGKINNTFLNVGNQIKTGMISNLDTVISKLDKINSMTSNLGLSGGLNIGGVAKGSNNIYVTVQGSTIQMNGTGSSDDLQQVLDKRDENLKNEIYDTLDDRYNNG